jgi:hypothetical protein
MVKIAEDLNLEIVNSDQYMIEKFPKTKTIFTTVVDMVALSVGSPFI